MGARSLGAIAIVVTTTLSGHAEAFKHLTCFSPETGVLLSAITIDLAKMKACGKFSCVDLKPTGRDVLTYDCVADKTFCAIPNPASTAGPFVKEDHFIFNTRTRAYERIETGNVGDFVSFPFKVDYSGVCAGSPP